MKKLFMICLSCISIAFFTKCDTNSITKQKSANCYDTILNYFSSRQKKEFDTSYKKLFVLTENGCASCNKNFLTLIKKNLSDKKSAFLFGSTASYIDSSNAEALGNVYIDQSLSETDYNVFHNTKVIFFKQNGIDTIINISAIDIQNQFEIISNRQ